MPFFYAFSIRQSVVRLMPRLCAARLWLSPLFSSTIRMLLPIVYDKTVTL